MRLAQAELAAGRIAQAIALLRAAARADRHSAQPRLMLAFALARAGEAEEAIRVLRRLIDSFPSNADAWFNLGNLYRDQRRLEEAAQAFERASLLRPGDPAAQINTVYVLVLLGKFGEAEEVARSVLARLPAEPDLLANLAQIQRATHRRQEAVATLDRCIALAPEHTGYRLTRAIALGEAGDAEYALSELDALIRRDPGNAHARFARSQILLSRGEYQAGWSEYLWRPDRRRWLSLQEQSVDSALPTLDDLRGRDVVLYGEQGLGDTLFFLRFAGALSTVAARVRLKADPRLREVLVPHWAMASDEGGTSIMVGDVPAISGASIQPSIELQPDAARIGRLRQALRNCGPGPYVGITWQAGVPWQEMTVPGESLFKRIPPSALGAALSSQKVTWISLQREPAAADMQAINAAFEGAVHDFSFVNHDLTEALALLYLLEDYIAVSNTNVHLNEALGKRTRVLVTQPAEWRWSTQGESSPWMPNAMLYRQGADGSWRDALEKLRQDLSGK